MEQGLAGQPRPEQSGSGRARPDLQPEPGTGAQSQSASKSDREIRQETRGQMTPQPKSRKGKGNSKSSPGSGKEGEIARTGRQPALDPADKPGRKQGRKGAITPPQSVKEVVDIVDIGEEDEDTANVFTGATSAQEMRTQKQVPQQGEKEKRQDTNKTTTTTTTSGTTSGTTMPIASATLQEEAGSVSSWDIDSFITCSRGLSVQSSQSTISMSDPDKVAMAEDLKLLARNDAKAASSIRSAVDINKAFNNVVRKNKSKLKILQADDLPSIPEMKESLKNARDKVEVQLNNIITKVDLMKLEIPAENKFEILVTHLDRMVDGALEASESFNDDCANAITDGWTKVKKMEQNKREREDTLYNRTLEDDTRRSRASAASSTVPSRDCSAHSYQDKWLPSTILQVKEAEYLTKDSTLVDLHSWEKSLRYFFKNGSQRGERQA